MSVCLDLATVPSDPERPNEDFIAAVTTMDTGVVVVLDGVTPPADGDTGCVHSVPWYTARLGGGLIGLADAWRTTGLVECLAEAIRRTATAHEHLCDLAHRRTPQATVAVVRWDLERVEYLVLSDAVVLLRHLDGRVTAVLDHRLTDLRARHGPLADLGELRNKPGGFHTAAADPAAARYAVVGSMPRVMVSAAAALTDGATRWSEIFDLGDWTALFDVVREEGSRTLISQVRTAETADAHGAAMSRRKQFDDASIAYVGFHSVS
ncbi:protein phosphatase 2C domain-containing protein [Kibdelosporangium lantanae]